MQRWTIGEVEVVAVFETSDGFGPEFVRRLIPEATRERLREMAWLVPHWADAAGDAHMVVQAFGIRSAGRLILVDTCIGNDKVRRNPAFHMLATPFLERLREAGFPPEEVDEVVCTHLHFDHVGWNTRWDGERWIPTFPKARYLIERRELEHWRSQGAAKNPALADSVEPLVEARLLTPFELGAGFAITNEVELVPTPGHTPGHLSVRVSSKGALAWVTGDALHHPCQIAHPEWTSPADDDQPRAADTRRAMLREVAETRALLLGTHFASPSGGRVRHRDGGAWFEAETGSKSGEAE